ncbi:SGNH/GDSL hydrolase family protein [[Clostridium] polysaccharolyticum]|uniref:GDSL-like Lipase/Acylhydrolase family protein n=1 Tax=[Clostridium] polysaccharolyticum TaxID=29364 RepID=A0A1I0B268_9FIRM|nr:SGNH/GDSL hydrolase family protein [[Clostridium] polysaccharolyticum]SET00808.1 GDSL-like Lipase/Acylhydrolase family protein [[Clostridium] polysaccharolyticum]
MIHIFDRNYFRYYGRTLVKEEKVYLGYTNSAVEFYVQGKENLPATVSAVIGSDVVNQVDWTRLKVYLDDSLITKEPIVLDQPIKTYEIAQIEDSRIHKLKIIKITEAQMSYAEFHNITIANGSILPLPSTPDTRTKVEFIGDSITCGYGVLGEPHSEFHIREEDGELSYAAITAKELNLNARYTAVSGYGVYCEYTGNVENTLPKVYPYTNYWVDPAILYDFHDFTPELVVINLGTNDSRFLGDPSTQEKFITCYIDFLKCIRSKYPDTRFLCICGTLCTEAFPLIKKACDYLTRQGWDNIDTLELPFHNVELDGQASEHPSLKTHQKDAKRLIEKIREIMPDIP